MWPLIVVSILKQGGEPNFTIVTAAEVMCYYVNRLSWRGIALKFQRKSFKFCKATGFLKKWWLTTEIKVGIHDGYWVQSIFVSLKFKWWKNMECIFFSSMESSYDNIFWIISASAISLEIWMSGLGLWKWYGWRVSCFLLLPPFLNQELMLILKIILENNRRYSLFHVGFSDCNG